MTSTRKILAAAAAALVAVGLTACSPAARDESGSAPAASSREAFPCPPASQLGSLTAASFTTERVPGATCAYRSDAASVRVLHGAGAGVPGVQTLRDLRAQQAESGRTTVGVADSSPGAFTAADGDDCSAWLYTADGVVTSVAVRRSSGDPCAIARSTAALLGAGDRLARPLVDVVGGDALGSADGRASWSAALSGSSRVVQLRADRTGAAGLAAAASRVDPQAAAVVLLWGAEEESADRLQTLRSISTALSRAAAAAPRARLIVVGPVVTVSASPAGDERLTVDLRAAARVAGARFIAVDAASSPARQLSTASSAVRRVLERTVLDAEQRG